MSQQAFESATNRLATTLAEYARENALLRDEVVRLREELKSEPVDDRTDPGE